MFKGWGQIDTVEAVLIGLFALFSLWQIQRALGTGKIASVSSLMPEKDRKRNPIGFWGSLVYYFGWLLMTAYIGANWIAKGGGSLF